MSSPFSVFLLLGVSVLIVLATSPNPVVAYPFCSPSDYQVLQGFYKSVESSNLSWPNHTNCCLWIGIQCSLYGRVVSIRLPSFNLSGSIPPKLSELSALQSLDLSNNSFIGRIPPNLANLSSLTVLDLSYNPRLVGRLPSPLPPKLRYLDVSHCMLHGSVPQSITNSSSLKEIFISHNFFSSFPPSSSVSLAELEVFDASGNLFNGSFPQILSNCKKLQYFNLEDQLGKLMDLETLRIHANGFNGPIPYEIGNCSQLRQLWLDGNGLDGIIPESLGKLSMLTVLSLANNRLEGPFPYAVTKCASLSFLSLSGNMLSGYIPPDLGHLRHLKVLLLKNNQFSGVLPLEEGFLMQLQVFDVSNNRQLEGLTLTGIGNDLDLRDAMSTFSNKLRQKVVIGGGDGEAQESSIDAVEIASEPKHWLWQVDKLLQFINICMILQTRSIPCLPLNLHVLGSHMNTISKLSPCFNITCRDLPNRILQSPVSQYRHLLQEKEGFAHDSIKVGVLAGVGVFCGVLLLVAVVIICRVKVMPWRRRRFGRPPRKLPSLRKFRRERSRVFDPTLASISMRDLCKATDGFDASRVVGDGGFGLVYCATLADGRTVAVKKLSTDGMQGKREFEAEMETLGKIKHPNLVELLAYCKVGDDRVLVYEFVENGSLDTWLHEKDDGPVLLNWERRVKIACGSARGLSFLHNDADPHVIHRDIKSSNILLGKDFEPQIADFGLARTMSPFVSHVSTGVAGTLGYMAPEYSMTLSATKQADVYSFGMVMLELASGRRPNMLMEEKNFRTLAKWARHMLQLGYEMDVLDPVFKRMSPPSDQVRAYFAVACDCVNVGPNDRPNMREVYERLSLIGVV